jgi:hypothetical protein
MASATQVLELLRRNDPNDTAVTAELRDFSDEGLSLAEALQSNEHVKRIQLHFGGISNIPNWVSLLRFIATRESLEIVSLEDSHDPDSHPDRATPFLLAIQRNPRVRTVAFSFLKLSGNSMASLLDTATSVTMLAIFCCYMEAPGSEGEHAMVNALQRNTNIQRLQLMWINEIYLIPILRSLACNTGVRELALVFEMIPHDVSLAMENLLESTTNIRRFELEFYAEEDTFRSIAHGLVQSKSVRDVKFEDSTFPEHDEVLVLNNILESKSNLQSLTLRGCHVHHSGREEFHDALFSLLQPHSVLRSLELFDVRNNLSGYGFETTQDFGRLLTAVQTSPLVHFSIGRITSRENCRALIASIPRMQLRTLEVHLRDDLEGMKGEFMGAIKRNANLRSVVAEMIDAEHWLDDDDMLKLLSYSARNDFFVQWIGNPDAVPIATWPEALDVAQVTGPDTVYRILVALAPSLEPFLS